MGTWTPGSGATSGDDTFFGDGDSDFVAGLAGNDQLSGNDGDDSLSGGDGDDTLIGGAGFDTLVGGSGADIMRGGDGDDTYLVDHSGDAIDDSSGHDMVQAAIDYTLSVEAEDLLLTGSALVGIGNASANFITGNARGNSLYGLGGADEIWGAGGTDRIEGGAGDDRLIDTEGAKTAMYGGAGNDELVAYTARGIVDGGLGLDSFRSDGNLRELSFVDVEILDVFNQVIGTAKQFERFDTIRHNPFSGNQPLSLTLSAPGILNLVDEIALNVRLSFAGSSGGDKLTFGDNKNEIYGAGGRDLITTGAEKDMLSGGDGDDRLSGGDGNDVIYGDAGNDTLIGGAGNDRLIETDGWAMIIDAGDGADIIRAGPYAMGGVVDGGAGLDQFDAQPFLGQVNGHLGQLTFANVEILTGLGTVIGTAEQFAQFRSIRTSLELASAGTLDLTGKIKEGVRFSFVGSAGDDVLTFGDNITDLSAGGGNDTATTGALDDWLSGQGGNDNLAGGAGADFLDGGAGQDGLTGGLGGDSFYFSATPGLENADTILDFETGADKLVLSRFVFSALSAGALPEAAFYAGVSAHDASDRIIYDAATGELFYDANGNGAGGQVLVATLSGMPAVAYTDFEVI